MHTALFDRKVYFEYNVFVFLKAVSTASSAHG
jgi:hypothetical protein